jgi:hypothetical protein
MIEDFTPKYKSKYNLIIYHKTVLSQKRAIIDKFHQSLRYAIIWNLYRYKKLLTKQDRMNVRYQEK